MKLAEKISGWLRGRPLSRPRMALALGVAVLADGLQLAFGPLGWVLPDQIIDVLAMIATMAILGFHILLLPTFMVELFPVLADLPTWTACVAAVIALRKRAQPAAPPAAPPAVSPPQPPSGKPPAIEI